MKRGFIYSAADGQRSQGAAGHQSIHSRPQGSFVSPRKRKRSPEPLHDRREAGLSDYLSGAHRGLAMGRRPKVSRKVGEDPFEEADDLDELGTAALEQYELTQREHSISPSPIPGPLPVSPFHDPIPASSSVNQPNICGTTYAPYPNPILSGTQKWGDPYLSHTNQPQAGVAVRGVSQNESSDAARHSPVPSTNSEIKKEEYAERIRQLQEQNYTKDGEVKVLRTEKQRLVGELKKREEQMHELHTRLLSEQKTKEQQLSKEKESLSTQLQFKEQEVLALKQKCALLEQKQKQTNPPVSPAPSSVLPQRISPSTKSQSSSTKEAPVRFLSTETFMPLSQMASTEVTPVQVGQKRSSQEGGQDFAGNNAPKLKSTKRSSIREARNGVNASKKEIAAPNTLAARTTEPQPSSLTELASAEEVQHPSQKNTPLRDGIQGSDPPVVLKVPNKELDGAQLLMLLIQHDLLKVPEFVSRDLSSDEEQSAAEQQPDELDDEPSESSTKLTGLLSLLNLRQQNQDSFTVFPNILTTPASADESGNLQDSFTSYKVLNPKHGNTPNTPVRRLNIRPPKPHTCGRTDISKTRSRQAVAAPVKALSASNTPIHSHSLLGEDATPSLASSIDRGELEKNIASFLRSADSSKFSRMGSVSAISPISFSVVTRSPDPSTVLLQQIGDIIVQYHSDQLAKAKASTLNASGLLDLGENVDSSSIASPKSSVGSTISSKTSSELTSPPKADQDLASQALELLEILVTYSKAVREQILMQPPQFLIDCRSSSAMGFNYQEMESSNASGGESIAVKDNSRTEESADKAPHAVEQSPDLVQRDHPQTATPVHRNVVQRKVGPFSYN